MWPPGHCGEEERTEGASICTEMLVPWVIHTTSCSAYWPERVSECPAWKRAGGLKISAGCTAYVSHSHTSPGIHQNPDWDLASNLISWWTRLFSLKKISRCGSKEQRLSESSVCRRLPTSRRCFCMECWGPQIISLLWPWLPLWVPFYCFLQVFWSRFQA